MARLALLSVVGSFTGPWVRIQPRDGRVRIEGLGDDESITMEICTEGVWDEQQWVSPGTYTISLLPGALVRFTKEAGSEPIPTTIEILRGTH